jgi:hypothetical protein
MIQSNARQAAAASNFFCLGSCLDVAAFGDGCDSGFAGCWLAVQLPALAGGRSTIQNLSPKHDSSNTGGRGDQQADVNNVQSGNPLDSGLQFHGRMSVD